MKHFKLTGRNTALLAYNTDIAAPLTPSGYLALRRTAAGLTQRDAAKRLAHRYHLHLGGAGGVIALKRDALELIRQLETPGARARLTDTIDWLAEIFPLDPAVYFQLANDAPDRHPFVCRGCGCSNFDPCSGSEGVCSCATAQACTRCIGNSIDLAEAA